MNKDKIKEWIEAYNEIVHKNATYEEMYVWFHALANDAYNILHKLLSEKEDKVC